MKKTLLLASLCLTLGMAAAWAAPVQGTTNPNAFTQDYIDWCQYGCNVASLVSPRAWVSHGGATGAVGLNGGFQNFYNLQQGSSWSGNFPSGTGLIYNGAVFGNAPTGIMTTFDSGVWGVGAYVQATLYGPFSATISLFDQNNNFLGSYTANGVSDDGSIATALFIGASGVGPIFAAQFDVIDQLGTEDFAIGQVNMNTTPEPGTMVLFGTSVLGLAGCLRRRFL